MIFVRFKILIKKSIKMKKILIVLFIVTNVFSCSKKEEEKETVTKLESHEEAENLVELTKEQYETAGIETGSVSIRNLSNVVTANGNIDIPPQNLVSISAPMGGFVRKRICCKA